MPFVVCEINRIILKLFFSPLKTQILIYKNTATAGTKKVNIIFLINYLIIRKKNIFLQSTI